MATLLRIGEISGFDPKISVLRFRRASSFRWFDILHLPRMALHW